MKLKLYVLLPMGHGIPTFAVVAESEAAAMNAFAEKEATLPRREAEGLSRYYPVEVYEIGVVATIDD